MPDPGKQKDPKKVAAGRKGGLTTIARYGAAIPARATAGYNAMFEAAVSDTPEPERSTRLAALRRLRALELSEKAAVIRRRKAAARRAALSLTNQET